MPVGRARVALISVASTGALLGLIAVSPLALAAAATVNLEWPVLSNVGQAYGAASSVLAGLALIGVTMSTILQARQTRLIREQAARELQLQIYGFAINDEELRLAIGPTFNRQHLYVNIWMMYQRMRLQIRDGTFEEFKDISYEAFQGAAGRAYWSRARLHFLEHWTDTSFNRRFVASLEEAYQKALADYPEPLATFERADETQVTVCPRCASLVQAAAIDRHLSQHVAE